MKILSQNTVQATQVPFISFAARGTLLHDTPRFEKWSFDYLQSRGREVEPESLKAKLLSLVENYDRNAEKEPSARFDRAQLFQDLLSFYFDSSVLSEEVTRALDQYHASIKVVIPQFVFDVCEELRRRGYRLAIVTNEDDRLIEILRLYHLIDHFDQVLLSQDVGAYKPDPKVFHTLLEELEIESDQIIHVGDRYATDIVGAQRAGIAAILYDPLSYELLALSRLENKNDKVRSIDDLRKLRYYRDARVLSKFGDLLEFFR